MNRVKSFRVPFGLKINKRRGGGKKNCFIYGIFYCNVYEHGERESSSRPFLRHTHFLLALDLKPPRFYAIQIDHKNRFSSALEKRETISF